MQRTDASHASTAEAGNVGVPCCLHWKQGKDTENPVYKLHGRERPMQIWNIKESKRAKGYYLVREQMFDKMITTVHDGTIYTRLEDAERRKSNLNAGLYARRMEKRRQNDNGNAVLG